MDMSPHGIPERKGDTSVPPSPTKQSRSRKNFVAGSLTPEHHHSLCRQTQHGLQVFTAGPLPSTALV